MKKRLKQWQYVFPKLDEYVYDKIKECYNKVSISLTQMEVS